MQSVSLNHFSFRTLSSKYTAQLKLILLGIIYNAVNSIATGLMLNILAIGCAGNREAGRQRERVGGRERS